MPKYMNLPVLMTGGDSSSIAPITTAATDLMTWVTTAMSALWTYIIGNPLLTVLCAIILISFAAGLFFRFVRSL